LVVSADAVVCGDESADEEDEPQNHPNGMIDDEQLRNANAAKPKFHRLKFQGLYPIFSTHLGSPRAGNPYRRTELPAPQSAPPFAKPHFPGQIDRHDSIRTR